MNNDGKIRFAKLSSGQHLICLLKTRRGSFQLIDRETGKWEIRKYTDQITQSTQTAADLTTQLLTLSRKHPIQNQNLNLFDLIKGL